MINYFGPYSAVEYLEMRKARQVAGDYSNVFREKPRGYTGILGNLNAPKDCQGCGAPRLAAHNCDYCGRSD